jgi:alkanesulfonate monooxygenase SsuD/methylene tetrahydromethanopterin reductase-like flavin-dependent oxidoreductase (luciferase family)
MGQGIEFGVFDHIEHLPGVPLGRLYSERLVQLEALDQAGFFAYHLAEHHTPAVHSMAPSQNVFLAAASQRTRRLRFGPGVYVIPLHHPLRLIEEVSMLDHLSDGRLEIGVGRGGVLEAYFWGQESDEESNQARYDEHLAVLLEGLSHDELTFHGRFWDFDRVPMRLRPRQQPYPPLWYMRNPETAARGGMNSIVVGSLDTFEANVIRYRRLWDTYNGEGSLTRQGTVPRIGLVVHVLVADTDAEAVEAAGTAWEAYRWNLGTPRRLEAERRKLTQFLGRADSGDGRGGQPDRHRAVEERRDLDQALRELSEQERETRARRRRFPGEIAPGVMAGSPAAVRGFMEEYAATGANYMVCSFQWGNLSHAQAMRSIELWATEVMPHHQPAATLPRWPGKPSDW